MLTYLPYLISAQSLGVIFLCVFMGSSIIFMIPAMATRGFAQFAWFSVGGALITAELVIMIVLVVMTSNRGGNFPWL